MKRIYGECQLHVNSSDISNANRDTPSVTGFLWCLYVKKG
jgi:hypothetical protein